MRRAQRSERPTQHILMAAATIEQPARSTPGKCRCADASTAPSPRATTTGSVAGLREGDTEPRPAQWRPAGLDAAMVQLNSPFHDCEAETRTVAVARPLAPTERLEQPLHVFGA